MHLFHTESNWLSYAWSDDVFAGLRGAGIGAGFRYGQIAEADKQWQREAERSAGGDEPHRRAAPGAVDPVLRRRSGDAEFTGNLPLGHAGRMQLKRALDNFVAVPRAAV